jgi:hypothetical protein
VLAQLRTTTGAAIDVDSRGSADPATVRISGTPAGFALFPTLFCRQNTSN